MINTLDEFISEHVYDSACVTLYDFDNEELAHYDGKNSIDEKYNDWFVADFQIGYVGVEIWIYEED